MKIKIYLQLMLFHIIKRKSKVTSISVVWRGDEYLPDPHIYPSDLDVYVVYDDGTTERLNRSDYDLYVGDDLIDGSYVGDLTSGTYVVTVQYGNNDNTSRLFKDSFEVKVAPPTAFTYEVTKQKITVDGVTYDGTAMITGFLGNTSIINIPETVEGTNTLVNYFEGGTRRGYNNDEYLVVGIKGYYYSSDLTAEGAYASCAYGFKDATMVEIPDSVTIIGDAAFKNCTDLESLDLTNITEIGDYAFYGCTSLDLTDLELPNLTKIGDYGFSKVTQIQSLRLTSIQYVGDYAFAGCEGITFDGEGVLGEMGDDYWTLSNGRTYLAYWTDQVTFGTYNPNWASGVVYSPMLGRDVFYDTPLYNAAKEHCEGNDDFVLVYTDSNCSILSSFLYDKTKIDYSQLTSSDIIYGTEDSYYNMYIYTQTQSIAAYTFYNCDFITGVYCSYPYAYSNVITVGDYAFSGCYRIHYMFDSSTTEFIQDLETGEVSDSWYSGVIYRLGKNPFHGCLGLARYEKIPEGVSFISRSEYIPYVYDTDRDDSFVVSDAISDIYNYNCSIYMPDSVKDIEEYTFYCANLNQVRLPDGLKKINDGVFRNASFNYWEEYYLPDSITEIGDYAFYDASFMMKLNLPKKLEYVGDYAFYQCYGLWGNDDVELPSGITHIGENAFNNCQIRGDIELPEKLSYLGDYAFHYNGGLISVKIPGSVTESMFFQIAAVFRA